MPLLLAKGWWQGKKKEKKEWKIIGCKRATVEGYQLSSPGLVVSMEDVLHGVRVVKEASTRQDNVCSLASGLHCSCTRVRNLDRIGSLLI